MADRIKDIVVGVVLAILAYLKPIEGELSSLMIVFTLNFVFGYLSGMIAKGENFELKKQLCASVTLRSSLFFARQCMQSDDSKDKWKDLFNAFLLLIFSSVVLWM